MKTKPVLVLVLALAITGPAVADLTGDATALFNDFLGRLTAKHAALKSLAMPGVEVRGVPGEEDLNQAAFILSFKAVGERAAFIEALEAEGIPYGAFGEGEREGKLLLFSPDMIIFVMQEAIGL
jgi:hypothetical protein